MSLRLPERQGKGESMGFDEQHVVAGIARAFEAAGEMEAIKRKDLLTPAEVERAWPWTVEALRKMREGGCGPDYVKVGRCYYYRNEDLRAFSKAHLVRGRAA